MATTLSIVDIDATINHEPRILDTRLAESLGFEHARRIRSLINRHRADLERFGEVCTTVVQTSEAGGRPGKAFWLTKRQALYLCTKSETPNATEVTIAMVDVFDAFTAGRALPPRQPSQPALLPPALRQAINRRAHALAQADFRRHRAALEDAAGTALETLPQAAPDEFVAALPLPEAPADHPLLGQRDGLGCVRLGGRVAFFDAAVPCPPGEQALIIDGDWLAVATLRDCRSEPHPSAKVGWIDARMRHNAPHDRRMVAVIGRHLGWGTA